MSTRSSTTKTETPPINRRRNFIGTPATNMIPKPIGNSTNADPRSGSFKIKINGKRIKPKACMKSLGSFNSSGDRLMKLAIVKIIAIFANSEG